MYLKLVSGRSIIVVYLTLVSARSKYRCVPQTGFCKIQVPMHRQESIAVGEEAEEEKKEDSIGKI